MRKETMESKAESTSGARIPLRVLLVEDSESDAAIVLRLLSKAGYLVDAKRVDAPAQYQSALTLEDWDIVISDYTLPQFNAPAALSLLHTINVDIPFIVVSGNIGEDVAVEMMKAGANDYLMKGNLSRLAPAVDRELRDAQIRRENRQVEEALRESEAQYRAVTESAVDAILIADHEGIIVSCNPGAQMLFGYTFPEMMGRSIKKIIAESETDLQYSIPFDGMGGGNTFAGKTIESRAVHKSGNLFPIELSLSGWETRKGKFMTAIVRDITERKHEQEQIQRQLEQLTTLHAIDQAMTASFDSHLTLNIILEKAIAQLGVDAADIVLMDSHSHALEFGASRGFLTSNYMHATPKLGEGYTARAILSRSTLQIPNITDANADIDRAEVFANEGFVAYFGSPLIAKGQIKGVLEVFRRASFFPEDEWLTFLETLASQAAITLDNIDLFTELQRSNARLATAYDATLEGWSRALDLRDKETEGHSMRVTDMTVQLARKIGLSEDQVAHIRRGAILHDIGKLGIPDSILLKPGELTDQEWMIMRQHPVYSYAWLSPIDYLRPALDIPYCHHEKWDGTGYPRRLKGDRIPLSARIFAIVDVWDALRSDRPYRKAWTEKRTIEYLRSESGTHFDPTLVAVFLRELPSLLTTLESEYVNNS
jgi:PAS domain S-box-containing protein